MHTYINKYSSLVWSVDIITENRYQFPILTLGALHSVLYIGRLGSLISGLVIVFVLEGERPLSLLEREHKIRT